MAAGPLVLRIACNGLNAALYYEQNGKNACVAKEIDQRQYRTIPA